jgi:NADH-quinone oxidoreductase subunit N
MITSLFDLYRLAPELLVTVFAFFVLIVDMCSDEKRVGYSHALTLLGLACAALATVDGFSFGPPVVELGGMLQRDAMGDLLKLFTYLTTAITLIYARHGLSVIGVVKHEFYSLILFAVLGICILISATNLVTIYLGLELLALSSYALVALDRDSAKSSEAAMKYFVLGAMASGLLLYGMSMLYGISGTLDLHAMNLSASFAEKPLLGSFALVFIVVGVAFKFGAAPFHMWLPDVYEGAPTPVATFIAAVPKLASIGMAFRLLPLGLSSMALQWQTMLAILAALSLVVGNLFALVQTNFKRMLAYSTISHVGFVLLGLIEGRAEGLAAAQFYAIVYGLMTAASFGILQALSANGFELENIDDFKGLNEKHPWYAFLLLLVMASLAGFPPLVGFWAKALVLKALWSAGIVWLMLVAAVCAVIGAFYYLRVIKAMYFDSSDGRKFNTSLPMDLRLVLAINALSLLALGIYWSPLIKGCEKAWAALLT